MGLFLKCPYCRHEQSDVEEGRKQGNGTVKRYRRCKRCKRRYTTIERLAVAWELDKLREADNEKFELSKR